MEKNKLDDLRASLAHDIKAARTRAGLSQEALAFAADIDRTYVSQLERGIANPSIQVLQHVADAVGKELTITLKPVRRTRKGR
jgi:transcriptional regulator with XRE-family HTH domain